MFIYVDTLKHNWYLFVTVHVNVMNKICGVTLSWFVIVYLLRTSRLILDDDVIIVLFEYKILLLP